MLKISKIQEVLNEAKEIKSIEAKKALISSAMNKLQKVYDIFIQLDILSERKDVIFKFMSMYQQGRFKEVIDGLSCECEDCLNSNVTDKIYYSNKGEWSVYNGIRFLLKDGILIIAVDKHGLSTKDKLKDYMIIDAPVQNDLSLVKEIRMFIEDNGENTESSLVDVILSAILSQLLKKCNY